MSKTTKQTGTKTTLQKTQARAASRQAKLKAKADAIRAAGKPATQATPAAQPPKAQAAPAAQPTASGNPLANAPAGTFIDVLNRATAEQLTDALKLDRWDAKQRGRIEAALKCRRTAALPQRAEDVAKTVEAVTKGDLAKGVEVPMPAKAKREKKARPDGKMSGLDAAAKVLAESSEPLNAKQIVEQAAAKGYWTSPTGKTPWATIYAAMIIEIAKKGSQARFKKTDRGLFTLADAAKQAK